MGVHLVSSIGAPDWGTETLRIWANARPLAIPTLYNTPLYHGM
jgi:hypothetical protein